MDVETFVEENKMIKIILNDFDNVIIETHDYSKGYEIISVNLNYLTYDFYYIIDLYKSDILNL